LLSTFDQDKLEGAEMTSISATLPNDGESEGPESITDIQNYLQSFNKEIGEDGTQTNGNTSTFYQLDAQVSLSLQLLNSF
jgi:hypothetical protein